MLLSQEWRKSTFRQRSRLLKTLVKYIVENQDTICRYNLLICIAVSRRRCLPPALHSRPASLA